VEFRDYFKVRYGPTIAAYAGLADDFDLGGGMEGEYLLLTARRAH
jgi:hypothetical protein